MGTNLCVYDMGVTFSIKLDAGLLEQSMWRSAGFPLSPLLFELYIEELEMFVKAQLPTAGPATSGGAYTSLLMYADMTRPNWQTFND
jgi:hypothetical protein